VIYPEDQKKVETVAKTALDNMSKAEVAPNPTNFHIWFDHLSGRNPALSRLIDAMQSRGMKFTPERNRDIYTRFLGAGYGENTQADMNSRLEANTKRVQEALKAAGSDTEKYGEALAHFSGNLGAVESKSEISRMVAEMAAETASMESQIQNLQSEVEKSRAEIAEMQQQLQHSRMEALTDRLTGIYNRRAFDEKLELLIDEAGKEKTPVSLVIADIDHFKKFNDTYGHQVGDQVLKLVAQTLKDGVKGRDIAARFGGEEFAIILPETAMNGAASVAENLRASLAARKLSRKDSKRDMGNITMSFGVTELVFGETPDALIARADALLYQSKHDGRNRVTASRVMPNLKKSA